MSTHEPKTIRRFEVVRRDTSTGTSRRLGTIGIDPMGTMTILSRGEDPDGLLPLVVSEQNRRQNMNVPIPPPPEAPRFAMVTRVVERGSDEFVPALADYLRQFYAIELNEA